MSRGTEYAKQILRAHAESNEKVQDVGFPAVMLQEMVNEISLLETTLRALTPSVRIQYEENNRNKKPSSVGEIKCGTCGSTVWEYGIRAGLWYLNCENGHMWVPDSIDVWFKVDTSHED